MKFSVIVSIENSYELINNFLEILNAGTDFTEGELIVVIDGCKDCDVIDFLRKKEEERIISKLLVWSERRGYSIANNRAAENAHGEYLVFINSDVLIQSGAINEMVRFIDSNADAGAVQARLIYPQNNRIQSTGHLFERYHNAHVYQNLPADDPRVMQTGTRQALTTALCAIRTTLFKDLGGFDESYYNAYEGMELTLKITMMGGKCVYLPTAVGYHMTGGTRNKIDFDDAYAGHLFWTRWHNSVKYDLIDYIRPQILDSIKQNSFFLIYCSSLPWWEEILNNLEISINGKTIIADRFSRQINLYEALPYDALRYGGNLLFVCNNASVLAQNYNWCRVRQKDGDIAIDAHGKVIKLSQLTGVTPDETQ